MYPNVADRHTALSIALSLVGYSAQVLIIYQLLGFFQEGKTIVWPKNLKSIGRYSGSIWILDGFALLLAAVGYVVKSIFPWFHLVWFFVTIGNCILGYLFYLQSKQYSDIWGKEATQLFISGMLSMLISGFIWFGVLFGTIFTLPT